MRRLMMGVLVTLAAAAALAAEPLMVRVTLYQRMPNMRLAEELPPPEVPDRELAAPATGWPLAYADVQHALSARKKGLNVFVAEIYTPKPLQADPAPAFFINELHRAVEIRPEGAEAKILLSQKDVFTMPAQPHATAIIGAKDEQIYLAVTLLPPSEAKDDSMVIANGVRPLRVVSRVDLKMPLVPEWRNRTGSLVTQLYVAPDGSVSSVEVMQHVQPEIDQAAVAALKQWRFEPPTRNGKPVSAYMMLTAPFHVE